jgi:hypothetical protein
MKNEKINLGEYTITISYNEDNGDLNVDVLDELGDIIESINITSDENEDEEDTNQINFNLN